MLFDLLNFLMAVDDQTQVDLDKDDDETTGDETDETDDELDVDVDETDTSSDKTDTDEDKDKDKDKDDESGKFDVQEILDEYDLESPADIKDFIANLADLKGKIGDRDFDELVKKAETLDTYQQHWAKQEREKKKDGETPEETISRLEKELDDSHDEKIKIVDQKKASEAAEKALDNFNDTVTSVIQADKSIAKEYVPFISEFLGVDNPVNEVDIENRADVRKIAKNGIKKLQAFEQVVIKRYREGKIKIPKVSSTKTSSPEIKTKGPKNLKEARKIMHQSLSALLRKKE